MIPDDLEQKLWAAIRKVQEDGGEVRNHEMGKRFGLERGLYGRSPYCLLGVLGEGSRSTIKIAAELNISVADIELLEAGFEKNANFAETDLLLSQEIREHKLYKLAASVAQQLEDEEALRLGVEKSHGDQARDQSPV